LLDFSPISTLQNEHKNMKSPY